MWFLWFWLASFCFVMLVLALISITARMLYKQRYNKPPSVQKVVWSKFALSVISTMIPFLNTIIGLYLLLTNEARIEELIERIRLHEEKKD